MLCSKNRSRGGGMTKLDMAGIAILCAIGLGLITLGISVAPDLRRYIKISRM
jgi:hypothetical protein